MTGVTSALLCVAAFLSAGALSLPDALTRRHHGPAAAVGWWLAVTAVRAAAIALLLSGLAELLVGCSRLVWLQVHQCLLQAPAATPAPAYDWSPAWMRVALGLFAMLLVLPPATAGAAALAMLFAQISSLWLVRSALPIDPAVAARLTSLTVALLLPTGAVVLSACLVLRRRPWRPDEIEPLRRLVITAVLTVAGLVLLSPVWLRSRCHMVCSVGLLVAGASAGAAALWWFGRRALAAGGEPGRASSAELLAMGLMTQRRAAWLLLCALMCLLHLCAAGVATAAVRRDGWRLLDRIAAQPELLCFRPDPSAEDWRRAAAQLEWVADTYAGHDWCGQWLLIDAWIEATRLHSPFRAWLILQQVRDDYRGSPATAPVGWSGGRAADRIAGTMLDCLGPIDTRPTPVS